MSHRLNLKAANGHNWQSRQLIVVKLQDLCKRSTPHVLRSCVPSLAKLCSIAYDWLRKNSCGRIRFLEWIPGRGGGEDAGPVLYLSNHLHRRVPRGTWSLNRTFNMQYISSLTAPFMCERTTRNAPLDWKLQNSSTGSEQGSKFKNPETSTNDSMHSKRTVNQRRERNRTEECT